MRNLVLQWPTSRSVLAAKASVCVCFVAQALLPVPPSLGQKISTCFGLCDAGSSSYNFSPRSRSAFPITDTELTVISHSLAEAE